MATDYTTGCGSVALKFIQMLAASIYGYHDIVGVLHYRINTLGASDSCESLGDFLECDTSHQDPERQLVENTFVLDDCNLLAWKIFNNTDDWEDYEMCGEVPQTLIQMLARSIVDYAEHNMINVIIDTDDCAHLTPILGCGDGDVILSERLLVTNLFAIDKCDRVLLKIFANSSSMSDYHTECTEAPESFYELLAQCIVLYNGHYYLNVAAVTGDCDDLHAFWTCANNHIDPERALVENVFCTDSCGNMALKLFGQSQFSWRGGDQ
jgi:hypothetical protein